MFKNLFNRKQKLYWYITSYTFTKNGTTQISNSYVSNEYAQWTEQRIETVRNMLKDTKDADTVHINNIMYLGHMTRPKFYAKD